MKKFFNTLRKDSVMQVSFWATVTTILIACITIILTYTTLPPFLPLYNQRQWGYDRLGKTYEIFFLPLLTIGVIFLNTFLGIKLMGKYPLLTRFLFITMLGLSFFSLIFVIRLVFLTL